MNIVGVFTSENIEKQIKLVKKYKDFLYALEVRVDTFYPNIEKVNEILAKLKLMFPKLKIILTCRSYKEGGLVKLSDTTRYEILSSILKQNYKHVDWIDIEYLSKIRNKIIFLAKKFSKKLILSYHILKKQNCRQKFNTFLKYFEKLSKKNRNRIVGKIVINTDNFQFYFSLLKFLHKKNLDISFFTVGKTSTLSRCFALMLNMPFVYATILKPVVKTQPDINKIVNLAKSLGLTS